MKGNPKTGNRSKHRVNSPNTNGVKRAQAKTEISNNNKKKLKQDTGNQGNAQNGSLTRDKTSHI